MCLEFGAPTPTYAGEHRAGVLSYHLRQNPPSPLQKKKRLNFVSCLWEPERRRAPLSLAPQAKTWWCLEGRREGYMRECGTVLVGLASVGEVLRGWRHARGFVAVIMVWRGGEEVVV